MGYAFLQSLIWMSVQCQRCFGIGRIKFNQLNGMAMKTIMKTALFLAWLMTALTTTAATHLIGWGQLGEFVSSPIGLATNSALASLTNVVAMTGGDSHMVAVRADGTVFTMGLNYFGQTNMPADVTNVVQITAGSTHSLALLKDGSVRFWGDIYTTGVSNIPPGLTANIAGLGIGPGAQHVLELQTDGNVLGWGGTPRVPTTGFPPLFLLPTNVVSLSAGSFSALALRADGKLVAWGNGATPPANATNVVMISSGFNHNLALRADGSILQWGSYSPTIPSDVTNVATISCGGNFSMALRKDGKLIAWGDNSYGQTNVPAGLTNIVALAGTSYGALALTADDGPPLLGLLGDQTVEAGAIARMGITAISTTPLSYQWLCSSTNLPNATNASLVFTNIQMSRTGTYSVIVSNVYGAVTSCPASLLVAPLAIVASPTNMTGLIAGSVTLSVSAVGIKPFTYQWQHDGTNIIGATGATLTLANLSPDKAGSYSVIVSNSLGGMTSSTAWLDIVPMVINSLPQNQYSFPGGNATFSISISASIPQSYQWQLNGTNLNAANSATLALTSLQYAQAGMYSVIVSNSSVVVTNSANLVVSPVAIWGGTDISPTIGLFVPNGLTNVTAVSAGEYHSLALKQDGHVVAWAWGSNTYGETNVPPDLTNAVAVVAGGYFSMALRNDSTITAWGDNQYGQTNVPADLTNVVQVAAGCYYGMALKQDGTVVAWGDNRYSQTNVPLDLTNAIAITASSGSFFGMALKQDGTVVAWGDNRYGQTNVPAGLSNIVAIAAGFYHALALKANGTVVGWGNNGSGEATPPALLSNVTSITAGFSRSCARTDSGNVTLWGYNGFNANNKPAGLSNVSQISEGYTFILALIGDGQPVLQNSFHELNKAPGNFAFSTPSEHGNVYRLEYKDNLSDTNWVSDPLVAGTGGILNFTNPTSGDQRFYRVRRW